MIMLKRNLFYTVLLICVIVISTVTTSCTEASKYDDMEETILLSSRLYKIDDTDELYERSDVVAKVKIIEGKENVTENSKALGHTRTKAEILEVVMGDVQENIITITEEYYVFEYQEQGSIYKFGPYRPLEEGHEYIIFLKKYADDSYFKDMYYLTDLDLSKFIYLEDYNDKKVDKMSIKELEISEKSDKKLHKQLFKESMKRYKKLKEDKDK